MFYHVTQWYLNMRRSSASDADQVVVKRNMLDRHAFRSAIVLAVDEPAHAAAEQFADAFHFRPRVRLGNVVGKGRQKLLELESLH